MGKTTMALEIRREVSTRENCENNYWVCIKKLPKTHALCLDVGGAAQVCLKSFVYVYIYDLLFFSCVFSTSTKILS